MEFKSNVGKIKALDEKGEGIAVIATLNVIDKDNDVTLPGAFGEQTVSVVPAHDWKQAPLGKARVHELNNEALASFKLNLKTSLGKDWYEAMKFDFENPPTKQQYSYGFSIREGGSSEGEFEGQHVRFLQPIRDGGAGLQVHEMSPVLLGAGVRTRTLVLKEDKGHRLSRLLNTLIDEHVDSRGKPRHEVIAEIADRAGVSPDSVRRVIRGDTDHPGDRQISAFARVLGVTIDRLTRAVEADEPKGDNSDHEDKRATPRHSTETNDRTWDGPANERRVKADETLRSNGPRIYAFRDMDADPETKAAWKFIHHFVGAGGEPGAASIRAAVTGIAVLNGARGGTTIPEGDRRGVWNHLAGHLKDADMEPPELRSYDEIGVKLVDQIQWAIWDAEMIVERVTDLKEKRQEHGKGLSRDRIQELKVLVDKLDHLLYEPILDQKSGELVLDYFKLRKRILDNVGNIL